MLLPEVQIATSTFHKFWTNSSQSFIETSKCEDVFTTMVSQTMKLFGIAIEVEALAKNLPNRNNDFVNRTL